MVPLVPCTTTSPALGLTKYASEYEIRRTRGQVRRGGIGELRDLHFFFFLCLANECLSFPHYLNPWKRLSPKVVKDRLYFTESASFQLTKLTGLTCSFRYQKPTDFHRKRLNLLTQKPLYLHVTLNILDD